MSKITGDLPLPSMLIGDEEHQLNQLYKFCFENIERLNVKFNLISTGVDDITVDIGDINQSVTSLTNSVNSINGQISTINSQISTINERLTKIEADIKALKGE